MDQDSFRRILEAGSSGKQAPKARGSFLVSGSTAGGSARKTIDASEPAFKPRKVKKSDGKYRDRAAERRVGEGNDYAQVEAVLEDFEKRLENKSVTDEQRKFLGGDSEHSILVKGLDFSLLEQNKAKAARSTVDDDSLEQAFMEAASEQTVPKKRTREDIIRELKEKNSTRSTAPTTDAALDAAKKEGKFKPIGFKPIGDDKPKKKKAKTDGVDGERKKKKRKVEGKEQKDEAVESKESLVPPPASTVTGPGPSASSSKLSPPPDDDFDIFADAGEYQGLDLGDEEEDENDGNAARKPANPEAEDGEESAPPPRKWFEDEEPEPSTSKLPLPSVVERPPSRPVDDEEEEGEVEQMRLVPLSSSAVPSIKDLLAMDEAANSSKKWKKKKDKKKGKGDGDDDDDDDAGASSKKKMTAEAKADRDYKRLKSYTDKSAS